MKKEGGGQGVRVKVSRERRTVDLERHSLALLLVELVPHVFRKLLELVHLASSVVQVPEAGAEVLEP